jgi:GMP synthase-like glutamine amidotransferase
MKNLKIHYFQHFPFEGPGSIKEWADVHRHILTSTKLYETMDIPAISEIDWLIIMGGPMSVQDEEQYPWLINEKQFIRKAIQAGKTVIGICLGSQLVAEVLGARVFKNAIKEIGWFDIELTSGSKEQSLLFFNSKNIKVFHWHGDTFDLPLYSTLLASSEGCINQAFIYNGNVLALQFHIESTPASLQQMIDNGRHELVAGRYVQTEEEILFNRHLTESNRKMLFALLDRLARL